MIISEGNSMVTTKFSEFLLASNNTWNSVSCVKYGDNVCKWNDISTCGLLFQCASTIKIQLSLFIWYEVDIIII